MRKTLFILFLILNYAFAQETSKIREHGSENLAIGKNALMLSDTLVAVENVAIGEKAMEFNNTGKYNVAIGPRNLRQLTSGTSNTALGNYTLCRLTTGASNTGIGQNALNHIVDGYDNVALGNLAGFNLGALGNSKNIFLGSNAGFNGGGVNTNWYGSNNVILGGWSPAQSAVLNSTMVFATGNGVERFRVNEDGKLGIGTVNPTFKLEVEGNFKVYTPNSYLLVDNVNSGENYYSASSFHSFQIAGDEKFRISSNGNVGVGTTTPDEKLTVKGKIHAEEIRVDLSVPGPDYVFDKQYQLKPLSEIQKYVAINKHLPEVPSAKEMEQNGINLSEMNMLLLKKIEELTLHLIELKNENTQLRSDFEEFKLKRE